MLADNIGNCEFALTFGIKSIIIGGKFWCTGCYAVDLCGKNAKKNGRSASNKLLQNLPKWYA